MTKDQIQIEVKEVLQEFFSLRKDIDQAKEEEIYQPVLDEEDLDILAEAITDSLIQKGICNENQD